MIDNQRVDNPAELQQSMPIMTVSSQSGSFHGENATNLALADLAQQFLPESPERMRQADLPGGDLPDDAEQVDFEEDEEWLEAKALMETIADDELADPQVGSERLLYRLFHERGVRVFEPVAVRDNCSCSRDKIRSVLAGLDKDEIAQSVENGRISVKCEFCSANYSFDPSEIPEIPE